MKPATSSGEKEARILIIVYEYMVRDILIRMLSASGYKAVAASVPLDGIRKFKKDTEKFDLVMIDMSLPGTSGLAVAKKIKRIRQDTPIVLIKAWDRELSREELKQGGVDFLLSKPFYMDSTIDLVRNAMGIEAG